MLLILLGGGNCSVAPLIEDLAATVFTEDHSGARLFFSQKMIACVSISCNQVAFKQRYC